MTRRRTIVGCGDAFGSGGFNTTCFKIDTRQATILLDCGASSLMALKAYHMNWRVLQPRLVDLGAKRVMITHLGPALLAQAEAAGLAGVLVARDGAAVEI
jgi:ribonuclease BN (tRNA processing enzyme)